MNRREQPQYADMSQEGSGYAALGDLSPTQIEVIAREGRRRRAEIEKRRREMGSVLTLPPTGRIVPQEEQDYGITPAERKRRRMVQQRLRRHREDPFELFQRMERQKEEEIKNRAIQAEMETMRPGF